MRFGICSGHLGAEVRCLVQNLAALSLTTRGRVVHAAGPLLDTVELAVRCADLAAPVREVVAPLPDVHALVHHVLVRPEAVPLVRPELPNVPPRGRKSGEPRVGDRVPESYPRVPWKPMWAA